ncbi:MAG: hypothetical protein V2A69_02375, partial [Pseudomonadota bacterium]
MNVFDQWNQDPDFVGLPGETKLGILSNYFNNKMVDDEFRSLPEETQGQIRSSFLEKEGARFRKPEPTLGRMGGALLEGVKDLPRNLWQAGRAVSESLLGEESPTSKYIAEVAQDPVMERDKEYDVSSGWLEDFARMMPQMAAQLVVAGATGGASAGSQLTAAAAKAAGKRAFLASTAFMIPQIAGGKYEELRNQGIEPGRAAIAGFADAIMQAPLEAIGISKFSKLWKPQKLLIQKIKDIGEVMGTEWLTEFLQAYPESATAIFGANPDKSTLEQAGMFIDQFWESTKQGAYEGTLTAPFALLGLGGGTVKGGAPPPVKRPLNLPKIAEDLKGGILPIERVMELRNRDGITRDDQDALDEIIVNHVAAQPLIRKAKAPEAVQEGIQAGPGEARSAAVAKLTEALTGKPWRHLVQAPFSEDLDAGK